MEDDLALRCARIYPGVNSRAELVTLAPGLRPEPGRLYIYKRPARNGASRRWLGDYYYYYYLMLFKNGSSSGHLRTCFSRGRST